MINNLLKQYLLVLVTFFFSLSSFANDNCVLPQEINLYNSTNSNDTKVSISSTGKPRIFFNNTPSMLGFVEEKLENLQDIDNNYKKVTNWIDSLIGEIFTEEINYNFFKGTGFSFVNESYKYSKFKSKVSNTNTYNCKGNPDCQRLRSGISEIATLISDYEYIKNGDFIVIVSDMMLHGDEYENDLSIQKLINETFANKKSIGIYGVKSQFSGEIFNLPESASGHIYNNASSRPFFIISIGDKGQVLKFNELLDRDPLKDISSENKNFTIYTGDLILNPVTPTNINNELFVTKKNIQNSILEWKKQTELKNEFTQLQKFTIPRRDNDSITIDFDLSSIQLPYTILLEQLSIETSVWKKNKPGKGDCWTLLNKGKDLANITQNGKNISIDFFGKSRLKQLRPREIYLVNFKVYADALGGKEKDFWMSDWNLEQTDVNKITKNGETDFPVLNLLKFKRKLDKGQNDEFDKRTGLNRTLPIEFNIAIQLDK